MKALIQPSFPPADSKPTPIEYPRELPARRGASLTFRNKTLLSIIDPIAQAERAVQSMLPLQKQTLYLCPSPLFGYGLEKLAANLPASSAVLCVEASPPLAAWTAENLRPPDAIRFIAEATPAAVCRFVRITWGQRSFRRVLVIRLTGGFQICAGEYAAIEDALRKSIAIEWGNAMTLSKLGRLYIRNAIRNLGTASAAPSIENLDFSGKTALVIGAGPSLNGFLDRFAPIYHSGGANCIIICVDTACSTLGAYKIKPDLVVVLEAQHWNLNDFVGLGDWNVPIAMDLSALPATTGVLGGCNLFFFTRWTNLHIFDRLQKANLLPPELSALGSVALSAVYLALKRAAARVILAGIDFSFTPDLYHCRASPGHKAALRRITRLKRPPIAAYRAGVMAATGKTGRRVHTDSAMEHYRRLFQAEFGTCPNVFDIEGSGLPLGVKTLSMEAALQALSAPAYLPPAFDVSLKENPCIKTAVQKFFLGETELLKRIRSILSGLSSGGGQEIEELLDEADYLWAHFPDCAAAGGRRPPSTDIIFLKRVRAEIDPFLKLFEGQMRNFESKYPPASR